MSASAPTGRARRPSARWSRWGGVAVAVVAALLVGLAVIDPGLPAADPRLHDGSVYVTNQEKESLGKFNRQVNELSGSASVGRTADIRQDANDVLSVDLTTKQATPVDAGSLGLAAAAILPTTAEVWLHAGRVVVSDPASGAVWIRSIGQLAGLQFPRITPDHDLGPGGRTTQALDGTPYGLSLRRQEVIAWTASGPKVTRLDFAPSDNVEFTVVGDRPVVLDRDQGKVWVEGRGTVAVAQAATARLQQPSGDLPRLPDTEIWAVVATPQGLYGVGERGLVELGRSAGEPAQPVVVNRCAYGAFSAAAATTVVTRCDRTAVNAAEATGWNPGNQVVFRVNRDEIVLNDVVSGNIWLVTQEMRLIQGWDTVTPPKEGAGKEVENTETNEMVNPNRAKENRPPRAVDDKVTVRAGRTTTLYVLDNDSDPDGDILTFADPPTLPETQGRLGLTRGGTALQLAVPAEATGSFEFSYTIDDGRGGKATAKVSVTVVTDDQTQVNSAPVRVPLARTVSVTAGHDVTVRVLLDWRDPEGDDLVLRSATASGDDQVVITPDGQLTFRDAGTVLGRKEVTVVVSDGLAETTGTVVIQAMKQAVPPVAYGDFVTARTGEQITVNPLLNDIGDDLVLARIDQAPAGSTAALTSESTFSFRADRAGVYYLSYVVSNGPRSFGLVRIDVRDAPVENRPPTTARDQAQLPAGGSVMVDPLANDEDPDNDVLVIQSVSQHPDLEVRIVRRSQVMIRANHTPDHPVVLTYVVSDGHFSVSGSIVVMPTVVTQDLPKALPDTLVVRAGDTGSVRVLANDFSPSGQSLALKRITEEPRAGAAWISGELLRFRAPNQPGEYSTVYEISDTQGRRTSAQVRIFVVDDATVNTPPRPEQVTERVIAGAQARIVVPLRGIDAEGDSVRLIGIDVPPRLGRVISVGDGQLVYEAYPDSAGTDTFTYRVSDARGATAVGTIRIGVVPRGAGNTPPNAVDDIVTARPGQTVRIPVLDNDTDPDGDAIGFASGPLKGLPEGSRIVDGRLIEIKVPLTVGSVSGSYLIVDARGAEAVGSIRIVVDPNATLQAPVVVDDVVPAWQVLAGDAISVPVLANDHDPDGSIDEATLSVPDDGVPPAERAVVVGRELRIVVKDRMQVVRYQVTDSDGLVSYGTVTVPGRLDAIPTLKNDLGPRAVVAGHPEEFDLSNLVLARPGRTIRITSDNRVWATHGMAQAQGATKIQFVAPVEYVGPASFSFEVTDGKDANDPDGRTAVLTVQITVLPSPQRPNVPPEVTPLTVTVPVGEGQRAFDLTPGANDPEGDPLSFSNLAFPAVSGLRIALVGTQLLSQADVNVPVGTRVEGAVTVSDGKNKVQVPIVVVVGQPLRPKPGAIDDIVTAVQGKPSTVSVLANDVNPFPGQPMTITGAVIEAGAGTFARTEDTITVTPDPNFVGTMVVRYSVQDVTALASRTSEARIRLTVHGRPDRPGTPRRVQVGDQTAVVEWTAPADNGGTITKYVVTARGGGSTVTQDCTATTCTISGLQNAVAYTMTVTAVNQYGTSDASSASAEIVPDVKPDAPTNPVAKFGDKELTLTWDAARTRGSSVKDYEIELSGPNGLVLRSIGTGTSYVWTGLENGSAYTFRVRARNNAPDPSEWSTRSRPEIPAGKPSAPAIVSAKDGDEQVGRRLTLTWTAPKDTNGAKIDRYLIRGDGLDLTYEPTAQDTGTISKTFEVREDQEYTITVVAVNKAGESPASNAVKVRVYSAPEKPRSVTLKSAVGGKLRAEADIPGWGKQTPPVHYYRFKGSTTEKEFPASGVDLTGTPGQDYVVQVRSCRDDGNGDKCSAWVDSNTETAWDRPAAPQVTATGGGGRIGTIAWKVPKTSNGRPIERVSIKIVRDGVESWQFNIFDGQEQLVDQPGKTLSVTVTLKNTEGAWSDSVTATVTNGAPTVVVRKGAAAPTGPNKCEPASADACNFIIVEVRNFKPPANGKVTCQLYTKASANAAPGTAFRTYEIDVDDKTGNGSRGTYAYGGTAPIVGAVCESLSSSPDPRGEVAW